MSDNTARLLPVKPMPGLALLKMQKTLEGGTSVIGIDIGVSSVNVAQTAIHMGKPVLIKAVVEPIVAENDADRDRAVALALKSALSGFNTRKAVLVSVISSSQVVVESMVMPVMPPQELLDAVKLELSSSRHFSVEGNCLDVHPVGRVLDKGVEKLSVLAAVAPNTAVERLLMNFMPRKGGALEGRTAAGDGAVRVDLGAIIPLAVAIENIVRNSPQRKDETIAVLEMGTAVTELNIYRNARLELSRKIAVTGLDLTRSLTSAVFTNTGKIELTMDEAERVKRQHGIPAPGENYMILDKIVAGQVLALLRPKLEQIAAEITRSFDYYHTQMRGGEVDRIMLLGGAAQLKGLTEFLNAELGLPVDLGDPLQGLGLLFPEVLQDKEDAQKLVQAIGASLADPAGINLLPLPLKERKRRALEMVVGVLAATAGVLIFAVVYSGALTQAHLAQARLVAAKSAYQALLPDVAVLKSGLRLKALVRSRPDAGAVLKQLSYLPPSVYLTGLTLKGGQISLSGFMVGEGAAAEQMRQDLLEGLKGSVLSELGLKDVAAADPVSSGAVKRFVIEGRLGAAVGTPISGALPAKVRGAGKPRSGG